MISAISTQWLRSTLLLAAVPLFICACGSDAETGMSALGAQDPDQAGDALIDRFSASAGMLQVRTAMNGLPAAGAPINFDNAPFITRGLGPNGQVVRYYNFDVKSTTPAPIYVLFRQGENEPVQGQLNIVDVTPGDPNYNDFWLVTKVTVPADYVANSVTSLAELMQAGYAMSGTDEIVNCPLVPKGSSASRRLDGAAAALQRGWYRGQVVYYFNFTEASLSGAAVPLAPIYVTFNLNPNVSGGGPPSGFKTVSGSDQTHNVISAIPSSAGYSPLWAVSPYDNESFDTVKDLASAQQAQILGNDVANVNCPVVEIEP